MTNLQRLLIVAGTAALFQVGTILATFSAENLVDWRSWLVSALVGVAQAVGVAVLAVRTAGGLSVEAPKPPAGGPQ